MIETTISLSLYKWKPCVKTEENCSPLNVMQELDMTSFKRMLVGC
uniref:Uncharacterized protein n=1 Tax=Nelumbo nucifera TaxID=4432 RepID=A0A822YR20_NELNU|nr:TPA_asm: hypothetical protein HUJ06_012336 [Nelumbo nucifera]